MKQAPPDADKRLQLKAQLHDRMRKSIQDQGAYGVRQTAVWERSYKLALSCMKRELPSCGTLRKRIKVLDDAHVWQVM